MKRKKRVVRKTNIISPSFPIFASSILRKSLKVAKESEDKEMRLLREGEIETMNCFVLLGLEKHFQTFLQSFPYHQTKNREEIKMCFLKNLHSDQAFSVAI